MQWLKGLQPIINLLSEYIHTYYIHWKGPISLCAVYTVLIKEKTPQCTCTAVHVMLYNVHVRSFLIMWTNNDFFGCFWAVVPRRSLSSEQTIASLVVCTRSLSMFLYKKQRTTVTFQCKYIIVLQLILVLRSIITNTYYSWIMLYFLCHGCSSTTAWHDEYFEKCEQPLLFPRHQCLVWLLSARALYIQNLLGDQRSSWLIL